VLPQAVAEHYTAQQRLIVSVLGQVRAEWARMGRDLDASWASLGPRILLLTASAQLGAARDGAAYVPETLGELGAPVDPVADVAPEGFAGVASDGRPLESLLYGAVTHAKTELGLSGDPGQALAAGGVALSMYVHTQVADAARGAASVAIAARPGVGWTRMVNPPCCGRCAILTGRVYRYSQGFRRHPRCDCRHIPATEDVAGDVTTSPDGLFREGLVRGLTKGQRAALAEGADPGRVVNASRKASGMTTTEAAVKGRVRLTPDGIYRLASDREETVRLLRANGYLL
jgi:hypothetical protein